MYSREADKLIEALKAQLPTSTQFVKNEIKPKSGSFEISLEFDDEKILIWSGHKLKPRKAKFPEVDFVLEELKNHFE